MTPALDSVTLTPGITAPDESFTIPEIEPVANCANAGTVIQTAKTASKLIRLQLIMSSYQPRQYRSNLFRSCGENSHRGEGHKPPTRFKLRTVYRKTRLASRDLQCRRWL